MSEREFKVVITGDATGLQSSAKDGAAAINDELNPAVESFRKDWRGAAKETEEFAKKGELKHMVRELKRDFPELGMLGRVMINPLVGGFAVLLGILKGVDEIFKGIIERSNTGIFSGTFRRDLEATTKAAQESEVAWRSFRRTMDAVSTSEASAKTKTDELVDSIRAQHVAVTEQQNADKAMDLARVDMLEKEEKLSGPQAIQKRLEIEEKYSRKKLLADIVAKDAEIDAKRKQVQTLNKDAAAEVENAQQAKSEMEEANRDLERYRALKTGSQKGLADTEKQVKALQSSKLIGPGQVGQLRSARDLESQLRTQLLGLSPEEELDLQDKAKAAAERYERSTKRAQELGASASELDAKIPGEQRLANAGYATAGNVAATERLTRTYQAAGQVAGDTKQLQSEIEKNIEAGHGVMVTTINKLKESTETLRALEQRVSSLEGTRRMYPPAR